MPGELPAGVIKALVRHLPALIVPVHPAFRTGWPILLAGVLGMLISISPFLDRKVQKEQGWVYIRDRKR